MSSENISSALTQGVVLPQSAQNQVQVSRAEKSAAVNAMTELKTGRNEKTAGGEDLPPAQNRQEVDEASVESAVSRITDFVQNFQRDLQFSIDRESDRVVVKVVDSETQEVIRQIPSEETLRIAKNLDSPESLILREQA